MSDNIRRTGRELVYQGAILEVYKDHMEFALQRKCSYIHILILIQMLSGRNHVPGQEDLNLLIAEKRRQSVKIQENRKFFVLFYMLGFMAGILYANVLAGDYIASMGIFSDFFRSTIQNIRIS